MILYHFTSHACLPSIMEEGLTKGEVPVSDREWKNAVNLTTDADPSGHGLESGGRVITEEDAARLYLATGQRFPVGAQWANKRAVRITVKLPSSDRNLKRWLPWARKHVPTDYLSRLHAAAGSKGKEKTWWLYFGVIPPAAFVSVEVLEPEEV